MTKSYYIKMSRNVKNTNAIKKPYCKVCFDAGKPESEYTSHWVRTLPDRSGKTKVTCPTLLSTECRYCYNLGHTAKFCPVLENQKKDKERTERRAQVEAVQKTKPKAQESNKQGSMFAALCDESSDDEEVKVSIETKPVENFPALGAPTKKVEITLPRTEPEVKTGWAAIAAKPKETDSERFMRQIEERSMTRLLPQSAIKAKPQPKPEPKDYTKPIYTRSWADWTDSDDSDEEEVEEVQQPMMLQRTMTPGWSTQLAVDDDEDW